MTATTDSSTCGTVLAFDVGTSGVKAVLTDLVGLVLVSAYRSYGLTTLPDGGVEQDFDEIVRAVVGATQDLVAGSQVSAGQIIGIASTAQMFNVLGLDAEGRPVAPMLSWLDQRAKPDALELEQAVPDQFALFGSRLTAKDVVPRINWLRRTRPNDYSKARWFLDCKEAMVMWLAGSAVMDPTGVSAFRLGNDSGTGWDPVRCAAAGVDPARLPLIKPATSVAGPLRPEAALALGLIAGIPVYVGTGDVTGSQLGAGAVRPGDAHLSLGTAAYFGLLSENRPVDPARNLAPLIHADGSSALLWLEIATGGAALAWALRLTGVSRADGEWDFERMEHLVAGAADGMGRLVFAPWFTGERVPVFDDTLRATAIGLDLHHGPGHLIRAVMIGVAYQLRWALEYGEAFGQPARTILAVGGGALGATWSQLIADVLGRDLHCLPEAQDAAAVGAAACVIVGAGHQPDFSFLVGRVDNAVIFGASPAEHDRYADGYRRFRKLATPEPQKDSR